MCSICLVELKLGIIILEMTYMEKQGILQGHTWRFWRSVFSNAQVKPAFVGPHFISVLCNSRERVKSKVGLRQPQAHVTIALA